MVKEILSSGKDEYYTLANVVFVCLMALIIYIGLKIFAKKKFVIEKIYLITSIVLGFCMTLIIPVGSAPDEPTHMYVSYDLSNKLMGVDKDSEGYLLMRKEDVDAYTQTKWLTREYINGYYSDLFNQDIDDELVVTDIEVSDSNYFLYFFSALGITVGRLLGLDSILMYLLGRWFNMLFFSGVTYFAIKKIPFGKSVVFVWALLPIMIQQTCSFSYDCVINALCILIIAMTFNFMYGEKYEKIKQKYVDIFMLVIACLFLLPCKEYALLPVAIFPLLILIKKAKEVILEKQYSKLKIYGTLALVCLLTVSASVVAIKYISASTGTEGAYVEWAGKNANSVGYFLSDPIELVSIFKDTMLKNGTSYINQMFGGYLGWMEIAVPFIFVFPFAVLLLYAGLFHENEEICMTLGDRLWFVFVFLAVDFLACLGMLLYWTPADARFIEGVQGRYFLPALVPVVLSMRIKRLCGGRYKEKIISLMVPIMYIFVVTTILKSRL